MEEISSQNSNLGLEDSDKLEAKGQTENTKRASSWGIKKFEKWCDKRKLKVDFNCVTPVELKDLLQKFYAEVKSEKGQPLTPRKLLLAGILFICALVVSFAALALCVRAANDTTRAQVNNIPSKSHVIPLLTRPLKLEN